LDSRKKVTIIAVALFAIAIVVIGWYQGLWTMIHSAVKAKVGSSTTTTYPSPPAGGPLITYGGLVGWMVNGAFSPYTGLLSATMKVTDGVVTAA